MRCPGVVTKGHSVEPAWIKSFTLEYKPDGGSWTTVGGSFDANTDQETAVETVLSATYSARHWRLD